MLFRPPADQRLDGMRAMLTAWNEEADHFRAAATAARQGGAPPDSVLIGTAEDAHDGLMGLLDDIDRALDALPAGHLNYSALLQIQNGAIAVLESVGNSLDELSRFVPEPGRAPVLIHKPLQAAQ
jgi:hypothetical protein